MYYLIHDVKDDGTPFQFAYEADYTVYVTDWFSTKLLEHVTEFEPQGDSYTCIEDWLKLWEDGRWQVIDTFETPPSDFYTYFLDNFPEFLI